MLFQTLKSLGPCGPNHLVPSRPFLTPISSHHVRHLCLCLFIFLALFATLSEAAETSSAVAIVELPADVTITPTSPATPSSKKAKKNKTNTSTPASAKRKSSRNRDKKRKKNKTEENVHAVEQHFATPDTSNLLAEQTCLMGDSCVHSGRLSACFKPHEPTLYDRDDRSTEDFYEMLMESCPHFFDKNDELLHPLCCSTEQEEIIARLSANVDLIRRTCPSCLVNVKKFFCNLFCAPNQRDLLRVDKVAGDTVVAVSYAVGETFVHNFYQSCQDVRVFGAYLLDYEYGCGKLKRANCTPSAFMHVLGSISEMPFAIDSVIVPEKLTDQQDEQNTWPRAVMNDTAYRCDQAPPNMLACHCEHCSRVCSPEKRLAIHGQHLHRDPEAERDRPNSLDASASTTKAKFQSLRSSASVITFSFKVLSVAMLFVTI